MEARPINPLSLFCSYSHEDWEEMNELRKHLSSLERAGLIATWHDAQIPPGLDFAEEIRKKLDSSNIVLCLLSANYMASNFCYLDEMSRAIERHNNNEGHVIPIILKPVEWDIGPLAKLKALPRDGRAVSTWHNEDEAYKDIAREIRRLAEAFNGVKTAAHPTLVDQDQAQAAPGWEQGTQATGPNGNSGIAVATQASEIQLKLDRDFDTFTSQEQEKLLRKIKALLDLDEEIRVKYKGAGCVLLKFDIPAGKREKLLRAIEAGEFAEFNIISMKSSLIGIEENYQEAGNEPVPTDATWPARIDSINYSESFPVPGRKFGFDGFIADFFRILRVADLETCRAVLASFRNVASLIRSEEALSALLERLAEPGNDLTEELIPAITELGCDWSADNLGKKVTTAISELLDDGKSPLSFSVAQAIGEFLGRYPDVDFVRNMLRRFRSGRNDSRAFYAKVIFSIPGSENIQEVVRFLRQSLGDDDPLVASHSLLVLTGLGKPALDKETLVEIFKLQRHEQAGLTLEAADALRTISEIVSPNIFIEALISLFESADPRERKCAIIATKDFEGWSAQVTALLWVARCLRDPDEGVSGNAFDAIFDVPSGRISKPVLSEIVSYLASHLKSFGRRPDGNPDDPRRMWRIESVLRRGLTDESLTPGVKLLLIKACIAGRMTGDTGRFMSHYFTLLDTGSDYLVQVLLEDVLYMPTWFLSKELLDEAFKWLYNQSYGVKEAAGHAVVKISDSLEAGFVKDYFLPKLKHHPVDHIRIVSARALARSLYRVRDDSVTQGLIDALGDSSWNVRQASLRALRIAGDEACMHRLVFNLCDQLKAEDGNLRSEAALGLANLDARFLPLAVIKSIFPLLIDRSDDFQDSAVRAFHAIGQKVDTERLANWLLDFVENGHPEALKPAFRILENLHLSGKPERIYGFLARSLHSEDEDIIAATLTVIRALGSRGASPIKVEAVVPFLESGNVILRLAATECLAAMARSANKKFVFDHLARAVSDPSDSVAICAVDAIARLAEEGSHDYAYSLLFLVSQRSNSNLRNLAFRGMVQLHRKFILRTKAI